MRTAVAIAIMVLIALLASLMAYILLRRVAAALRAIVERRARARLTPAVQQWLESEPERLPPLLAGLRPFPDRPLFVQLCLELLPGAGPTARRRLLCWLESQGYVDRWIRDLDRRSPWRRARAAELLGVARVPRSVKPLIEALGDPVPDVRMRAAKALGALGGRRARAALVKALADDNRWSVIRVADLLRQMGEDVVGELVEAFPSLSRSARLAVLELVSQLGDATLTPFLAELLDDLDRDVRARAAVALGRIGDGRSISALRGTLQDSEWPVRAMSARALGNLGAIAAIRELRAALRDDEWWVRANAAEALARLGQDGLDALCEMLDDQDAFARDQALSALESRGELDRRLAWLCSRHPGELDAAMRLIQYLETRHPLDRVERIRQRQPDPVVRRAIESALAHPQRLGAAS